MKPVLEILIPTYNRSESAQKAIESVLECNDERISVRCNSNGYDHALQNFCNLKDGVHFDYFESNEGVHANILKVLSDSNANFCMLLSDEDRINSNNYEDILKYLENLDSSISAVSCSIHYIGKPEHFWKPIESFSKFNLNDFVSISPIPTYMSGLMFKVDFLRSVHIESFYKPSIANAYPHIDLTLQLLTEGMMGFYHGRFVEKGEDLYFGGDGHSHKNKKSNLKNSNTDNNDFNPLIYGPKARSRQFFYRESLLGNLKSKVSTIPLFIGKLNYLEFHYGRIINSHKDVIIPDNTNERDEALSGFFDSKENGEYSGSIVSFLFKLLLVLPRFISNPIFYLLSFFNKLMRKAYMLNLHIFRKKK